MSTEVCMLALQNAVNEIKENAKHVSNILIFDDEKQFQIKDESTTEEAANKMIETAFPIFNRANAHGGLEYFSVNGENIQFALTRRFPFNFADVITQNGDKESGKIISHVLAPTILRIAETLQIAPDKEELEIDQREDDQVQPETVQSETLQPETDTQEQEMETDSSEPIEDEIPEQIPEPPVTQFMVEDLKSLTRLIGSKDTVQVDRKTISQWTKIYPDKSIEEVLIEDVHSKKQTRCRFKPIKDSKLSGKGVIQIPDKVQSKIKTKKGALVTVSPVIE